MEQLRSCAKFFVKLKLIFFTLFTFSPFYVIIKRCQLVYGKIFYIPLSLWVSYFFLSDSLNYLFFLIYDTNFNFKSYRKTCFKNVLVTYHRTAVRLITYYTAVRGAAGFNFYASTSVCIETCVKHTGNESARVRLHNV